MPESRNIAPPGYYMLFALNSDGTPSESAVIQLTAPAYEGPLVTKGNFSNGLNGWTECVCYQQVA